MPCNDITDSIKIQLDADDRLMRYALRKKTCNGEVGRKSLLNKYLLNRLATEIIKLDPAVVQKENPNKSQTWEYLTLKHFVSVKAALEVMLGESSGSVNDFCTIESIEYSEDGTLLLAELSNDGLTKAIDACGGCDSCGTDKKEESFKL